MRLWAGGGGLVAPLGGTTTTARRTRSRGKLAKAGGREKAVGLMRGSGDDRSGWWVGEGDGYVESRSVVNLSGDGRRGGAPPPGGGAKIVLSNCQSCLVKLSKWSCQIVLPDKTILSSTFRMVQLMLRPFGIRERPLHYSGRSPLLTV